MKRLRDLLVDGMLLALPLAAAAFLLHEAIGRLVHLLAPVAHLLPPGHLWGVAALEIAAMVALVLLLLLLGLFARSAAGRKLAHWLEDVVLSKVPGYMIFKSIAAGFTDTEHDADLRPALVSFDDNQVLGFVVEQDSATDRLAVFLPGAPSPGGGNVVVVPAARVQLLDASLGAARRSMKQRGLGLLQLMQPLAPSPGAGA
jgi:uncharacterized membrane protein